MKRAGVHGDDLASIDSETLRVGRVCDARGIRDPSRWSELAICGTKPRSPRPRESSSSPRGERAAGAEAALPVAGLAFHRVQRRREPVARTITAAQATLLCAEHGWFAICLQSVSTPPCAGRRPAAGCATGARPMRSAARGAARRELGPRRIAEQGPPLRRCLHCPRWHPSKKSCQFSEGFPRVATW